MRLFAGDDWRVGLSCQMIVISFTWMLQRIAWAWRDLQGEASVLLKLGLRKLLPSTLKRSGRSERDKGDVKRWLM